MLIAATERRTRTLASHEWAAIEQNTAFWRLLAEGYIGVSQVDVGRYEIRGNQYVGRAIAGDVELIVKEKVAGALEALVSFASGSELLLDDAADSPASEFDRVSMALMREFVRAAGRYIAERREPRFRYQQMSGAALGGSFDPPRTLRLHARGQRHLLAYSAGRVVRDSPLDRVTLAALDEIDRAGPMLGVEASTLFQARWLAGALEDVRDEKFHLAERDDFLAAAETLASRPDVEFVDRDLAKLATVVILHQGFEWSAARTEVVPRAWFIDLERLFEQAVRRGLRDECDSHRVDRGEPLARRLFSGGVDSSKVNPDLVVRDGSLVQAVGDVKYKSLHVEDEAATGGLRDAKGAGRQDLYQLLVHASSLGAATAFLVYPAEATYRVRYLGRSSSGIATWTAEVRPHHLRKDLGQLVDDLRLATAIAA